MIDTSTLTSNDKGREVRWKEHPHLKATLKGWGTGVVYVDFGKTKSNVVVAQVMAIEAKDVEFVAG